ncbi:MULTISPECIES: hypothetical protein [unclassified Endozoicomonas]|uniref:hypothetical protein n=1 Tax=unclassified Endozoicomonas TaxID=2644528 RepID=UPI002148E489|nr:MULTISPECIES: hypothetical protein [unclassified Endozoicomonas]
MTERIFVEIQQNSNRSFTIKRDQRKLSGNPSHITDTGGCAGTDFLPDEKRQKSYDYGAKMPLIESISWQLLYATNLLVGFELILSTIDTPLSSNPHSGMLAEVVVSVGWLLKCYWNPYSRLFSPIQYQVEQQESSQDRLFATITVMFGSGCNQQSYQPTKSSSQQAPQRSTYPSGYFASLLHSDYEDGNEDPQQHPHTLGLNCFVHPCHGTCQLRPSSDNTEPSEWPMNFAGSSCLHLATGYCFSCVGHLDPLQVTHPQQTLPFEIRDDILAIKRQYDFGQRFPPQAHGTDDNPANNGNPQGGVALDSMSAGVVSKGQRTCVEIVIGEDGRQRPCGRIWKSSRALSDHKRRDHSGQQTCDVPLIGQDGQPRPCGSICRGSKALSEHKRRDHSGQQTCIVTVIGEDGHRQRCGKVLRSAISLTAHKSSYHSGQKTCDMTVVGEDGQLHKCGMLCINARNLASHKRVAHTGQKTCGITVVGKDGQPRPCGMLCKNARDLSYHRRKIHSGPKTCDMPLVSEDGQQRPCGLVCKSAPALTDHKKRDHTGQQTCNMTVVGENGQLQRCGQLCDNARALLNHKKKHRKSKFVDVDQNGGLFSK